jgi:hypothetical protein
LLRYIKAGTEIAKEGRSNTGGFAMPIQLRPKARAQAVRPNKRDVFATIDWLGLWGLSLGVCAIVLAGIADFVGHDNIGAAFILVGTAGIIAVIVCAGGEAENE